MKIDNETIDKIFALYWGQDIANWGEGMPGCNVNVVIANSFDASSYYLEVLPLSDITDEDAVEVAKICGYKFKTVKRKIINGVSVGRSKLHHKNEAIRIYNYGWIEYTDNIPYDGSYGSVPVGCYDYLRSKGYALPAFGYSVDQLVEAGVFKLKEVEK